MVTKGCGGDCSNCSSCGCASGTEDKKQVAVGQQFTVQVPSNPTTGHHWEAKFDDQKVGLVGSRYLPPNSTAMGAGGTEVFTFVVKAAGDISIDFEYKRPGGTSVAQRATLSLKGVDK